YDRYSVCESRCSSTNPRNKGAGLGGVRGTVRVHGRDRVADADGVRLASSPYITNIDVVITCSEMEGCVEAQGNVEVADRVAEKRLRTHSRVEITDGVLGECLKPGRGVLPTGCVAPKSCLSNG